MGCVYVQKSQNIAEKSMQSSDPQTFTMLGISLVICRNNKGQYLTVKECGNRGWWVPGGLVDPPESFQQAAIRETVEEAGVHVELKGILRAEFNIKKRDNYERFKLVFYAEPIDQNEPPKSVPDSESLEARWVTMQEYVKMKNEKPGWRGPELYDWATYIETGGVIYPMSMLDHEGSEIKVGQPFTVKDLPINK